MNAYERLKRYLVKCKDCPAIFETTNPAAERCPLCRAEYRKQYLKNYRKGAKDEYRQSK